MSTLTQSTDPSSSPGVTGQLLTSNDSRMSGLWNEHVVRWGEKHHRFQYWQDDKRDQIIEDRKKALARLDSIASGVSSNGTSISPSGTSDVYIGSSSGASGASPMDSSADQTPVTSLFPTSRYTPVSTAFAFSIFASDRTSMLQEYISELSRGDGIKSLSGKETSSNTAYSQPYDTREISVYDPSLQSLNSSTKSASKDYTNMSVESMYHHANAKMQLSDSNAVVRTEMWSNSNIYEVFDRVTAEYNQWESPTNETPSLRDGLTSLNKGLDFVRDPSMYMFSFTNAAKETPTSKSRFALW